MVRIGDHEEIPTAPKDLNACACGTNTSLTWEEHVLYSIRQEQIRQTKVDVCTNCGDLVIDEGSGWAHYRGPGSRLGRCQHTVEYGPVAEPKNNGLYTPQGGKL